MRALETLNRGQAVTASDSTDLPLYASNKRLTDAINVGGAGTVVAVFDDNSTVTMTAVAGALLPIAVRRINATGTSATGLVALYQQAVP